MTSFPFPLVYVEHTHLYFTVGAQESGPSIICNQRQVNYLKTHLHLSILYIARSQRVVHQYRFAEVGLTNKVYLRRKSVWGEDV